MFASGERIEMRRPNPGGFKLDHGFYVPLRQDAELALALADVAEKAKKDKELKIPLRICSLGEFTFVFFSLDNEQTWELAIDKDRGDPSWLAQVERMKGAEALVTQKGNEAARFFQELLSARDEPIVLNGLRRRHRFEALEQAQNDLEVLKQSPDYQVTPRDLNDILAPTLIADAEATASTPQPSAQSIPKKPRKTRAKPKLPQESRPPTTGQSQSEQATSSVPPPPAKPYIPTQTDNEDFLRRLNQRLGLS